MHFVSVINLPRWMLSSTAKASAITCCSLWLGGCVAPLVTMGMDAPRITAVTPQILQQGKATTLNLQVSHWVPGTQLALMSAAPYRTHQLGLSSPPRAMLAVTEDPSADSRVVLATADQRLSIIDFPVEMKEARILAQIPLAGAVTQMAYAKDHLLVSLADGRLQWLNIKKAAEPKVLATLPSVGKLLDVQLDAEVAYLLLATDAGKTQLQRWFFVEGKHPRRDQQWLLPVAANAFAVQAKHVWAVSQDGIAVLDIADQQAVLKDFRATSGLPNDVQLQDDLALVADGRGGLVLFDISTPDVLQWRGSYNKRGAIRGFSQNRSQNRPVSKSAGDASALLCFRNNTVMRLGLANPELPSSGATFKADAPIVLSALQGDAALLATEHGLQRVMMVGNGDTAISPEGVNLGGSRRGAFGTGSREDILYVADWFSGLHLYDISNPRQLRHLSNYHTPGSSKGVALLGNYALVGDDDQGLQIIDIEDPRRPSWTAELSPKAMADLGLAYTMKLVGKILYLADHRGGFHIIDLSDIYHPHRLGGYDTPGKAWDIDVDGDVAFVADDSAGLLMFDVSNPANPEPFAQFNPGGQAEAVALQDGRAYVAFFDKGLYTLDVSDPRQIKIIGHTPIPGNARGIELGDGLIYVASWEAGLQIVDTRGPLIPQVIGSFDTDGAAWGVKVKDGYAYVLDWWGGIKVVDVRQPSRPAYVGRYQARGTLQQLRPKGTYLYAASGAGGLQVYDIKNPLNPIWVKGLDIDSQSQDLWIEDDRAYVAAGDGGVAIFDILDPFYSRQVGGIDTPGEATKLAAGNDYLYIADNQAGLLVMDVRDPQRPVEVARYDLQVRDLWLHEQDLWLVTDAGLSGWLVAADGTLTQHILVPGEFTDVQTQDDLVVASTPLGMIKLWQRSGKNEPQALVEQGQYDSSDVITGLWLERGMLYVVGRASGLSAVDISQPQSPRLTAVYPATGNHTQIAIARGAAFLAGESKLASVTLLPTMTVEPSGQNRLTLHVPADLPLGDYHLLVVGPEGQRELRPNALKVRFSAPGKRKFSLGTFRQLLKAPLKPPTEAINDIPADSGKSP